MMSSSSGSRARHLLLDQPRLRRSVRFNRVVGFVSAMVNSERVSEASRVQRSAGISYGESLANIQAAKLQYAGPSRYSHHLNCQLTGSWPTATGSAEATGTNLALCFWLAASNIISRPGACQATTVIS